MADGDVLQIVAGHQAFASPPAPTLAEVLVAGNDTGGANIVHAPGSGAASLGMTVQATGTDGANFALNVFGDAVSAGVTLQGGGDSAFTVGLSTTGDPSDGPISFTSQVVNGAASFTADMYAQAGTAKNTLKASAPTGDVQLDVVAGLSYAEILVNQQPLYTEAAGAPGVSFVSLFYRDTTSTTGGTYLWDFRAGSYQKIALALT